MKNDFETGGFTLVELLVAMAVSGIIMAVVVSVFWGHQATAKKLDELTRMRNNLRGTILVLQDSIQGAGFDPDEDISTPISGANTTSFSFSRKDQSNITNTDNFSIALNASGDINHDGIADSGVTSLVIQPYGNVSDDVVAVSFAYAVKGKDTKLFTNSGNIVWLADTDGDGFMDMEIDTNHDGKIDGSDTPSSNNLPSSYDKYSLQDVRAVRVWILVRTQYPGKFEKIDKIRLGYKNIKVQSGYGYLQTNLIINCNNMERFNI